ncbi:MAG: nitrate reductase associated protein, partial [Chitinophagaceae bacterium]
MSRKQPSEFLDITNIEYFKFEEDFVEENVRCIPMIVRFKMDAAGIKLKLAEWSKFTVEERRELAIKECSTKKETNIYKLYLKELVGKYTGMEAIAMEIEKHPAWADPYTIPLQLSERTKQVGREIAVLDWREL